MRGQEQTRNEKAQHAAWNDRTREWTQRYGRGTARILGPAIDAFEWARNGPEQRDQLAAFVREKQPRRIAPFANQSFLVEPCVPRELDQLVGRFTLGEVHVSHA